MELSISPSSAPTPVATSSRPSLQESQSPSAIPSKSLGSILLATEKPTDYYGGDGAPFFTWCDNNPDFLVEYWDYYNCSWHLVNLTCDDDRVTCYNWGGIGLATDHCCKCKHECRGQCNPVYKAPRTDHDHSDCHHDPNHGWKDDYYTEVGGVTTAVIMFLAMFGMAVCARVIFKFKGRHTARREVQQTMTARRQQQRENNTQGLTVEERNNARYELFVTKFYFQAVLPDKSNTKANTVRSSSASNMPDEEHPNMHDNDDDTSTVVDENPNPLSELLSSWRRQSPKNECCICLEGYTEGETICVPMTTECNHVFHEGCILEWLKTKDRCPLCRVELLQD